MLNRQINRLYSQNEKMRSQIKQMQNQIDQLEGGGDPRLQECLREIPVSQYLDYLSPEMARKQVLVQLEDGMWSARWIAARAPPALAGAN